MNNVPQNAMRHRLIRGLGGWADGLTGGQAGGWADRTVEVDGRVYGHRAGSRTGIQPSS